MSQQRVLVFLATGKQGRGVVSALSAAGGYTVLAQTRSAKSGGAKALAKLPGVQLVEAPYDVAQVFDKAAQLGLTKGDAVFSVQKSFDNPDKGLQGEIAQGKAIADAAAERGLHLVYSSVGLGADTPAARASAARVPHFESKLQIEAHIAELRKSHADWKVTVLRPVAFYDNFAVDQGFQGRLSLAAFAGSVKSPLQFIACSDIGGFVRLALQSPEEYDGLEIAGDELTMDQLLEQFKEVKHRGAPMSFGFFGWALAKGVKEMREMIRFFNETGYAADIPALRQKNASLKTWKQWLEQEYDAEPSSSS